VFDFNRDSEALKTSYDLFADLSKCIAAECSMLRVPDCCILVLSSVLLSSSQLSEAEEFNAQYMLNRSGRLHPAARDSSTGHKPRSHDMTCSGR
jgi:hypothetical protein